VPEGLLSSDLPTKLPHGPATDGRPLAGLLFTVRLAPDGAFAFHTPTPGAEELLELTSDDLGRMLNARTFPFLPDEDPAAFSESIRQSAAELTTWRRELRVVGLRSGRESWFRVDSVPTREPDGTVVWAGMAADVTDQKLAERRLREAYRKLDFHIQNTPLAVVEWEHGTHIARWNGQAEAVFGWSAGEVIGKTAFDFRFVHDDDVEAVRRQIADMLGRRQTRTLSVNRNYTRAGGVIWCEWHNSALLDDAGRVVSVLSLVLDVTARWAAADALARSEAALRSALGSAKMIGWDFDIRTRQGYFSTDYAAFFGLPKGVDYTNTDNAWVAVHPDDRPAVMAAWDRSTEHGGDLRFEFRGAAPGPNGGPRWFVVRGHILRGSDGRAERVVAVTTDVTEQKRAEREREVFDRQLQETQKWESLGVLAGGVAHDFNNILTVVLGSAGLARRTVPGGSPAAGLLDQIEAAARRAGDLCRQMLAYAGRGSVSLDLTDLAGVIRESAVLLQVPAAGKATVVLTPDPAAPKVRGDPAQVRQVLVNLVMNAAEAIGEDGGEVRVRTATEDVTVPADGGYVLPAAPGRYTVLEVSDTGPGIAPEVRARMFDPFFTTKFAGRGLGLSAVLGIVRAHRGAIRVETAPGQGTTIRVYWPAATGPGDPTPPAEPTATPSAVAVSAPVSAPDLNRATDPTRPVALVVDDEIYVREVAASTLEELGYEPVIAADGPGGLALFREHRVRVRVAVVDVMMPGMSGEEVVAALRGQEPALPVVVMSGFTDRQAVKTGTGVEFVQKPFHPEDLAAAVQRVTRLDS
jgi:PAS domain S-box-containing protein